MKLRFDMHIHSAASQDGRMTIDEIVAAAKDAGLQGVAVTDHDVLFEGAPEAVGFLIIPGCEFSTEYGHLLGLFLIAPINASSFAETVDAIHAQGGLAVLAHPFEHRKDALPAELAALLDGVEVWNGRAERKVRDANAKAKAFAEAYGLLPFAGSDAHLKQEIGNGVTVTEADELSLTAVKEALLNGKIETMGKRSRSLNTARSQFTRLKKRRSTAAEYGRWLLFAGKCALEDMIRRD